MAAQGGYLNLYMPSEVVKTGIQEISRAMANTSSEDGDIFVLRYGGWPEKTRSIGFMHPEDFIPSITIDDYEIARGNETNWMQGSNVYVKPVLNTETNKIDEVRIGPDVINKKTTTLSEDCKLVLTGNPCGNPPTDEWGSGSEDKNIFKMMLGGKNLTVLDGDTRFTMHGGASMDLTGDASSFDTTTRFTMHGGAKMDLTADSTGIPELFLHGKSRFSLDRGDPDSEHWYEKGTTPKQQWTPKPYYEDIATIDVHDCAHLMMNKESLILMDHGAAAVLNNNALLEMHGGRIAFNDGYFGMNPPINPEFQGSPKAPIGERIPRFIMNGGSITVNVATEPKRDENNLSYDDFIYERDPVLDLSNDSFFYTGQGVHESSTSGGATLDFERISPETQIPSKRNPFIKIADESSVIIDGASGKGCNYIKIGACENGHVQTHILDNTHLELRQNSIFSLRGNCQKLTGIIDDYPITRMTELTDTSGSMFTMYDNSTFIMRSDWEEYTAEQYTDKKDFRNRPLSSDTWQPNLDFWKQENSPLFGMVGNSVLKIQGNSELSLNQASIIADGNNFTFKSGEESVSFTINELQQLKALLGA